MAVAAVRTRAKERVGLFSSVTVETDDYGDLHVVEQGRDGRTNIIIIDRRGLDKLRRHLED